MAALLYIRDSLTNGSAGGNSTGKKIDLSKLPHDDLGPQLNYTIWLLTMLAAGFLGLRVYCKLIRHRGLWWDDHVLIVSWVALVAQTALVSYNTTLGYGKHIWDWDKNNLVAFGMFSNTSGFFSTLAAMLSKTSFAITVLRISDGWTKRFIWFIIVSINLTLGFGAMSLYIQCSPVEKVWRPWIDGRCWPKQAMIRYHMFTAAYSGAMDIILAILPWRIVWNLTMNKKEKVGVLLAMSMGVFAGATSLIKISTLPSMGKKDLFDGIWLSILGTAESAVTIMAASIPVLRALFRDNAVRPPPVRFHPGGSNVYTGNVDSSGRGGAFISSKSISAAGATKGSISSLRDWGDRDRKDSLDFLEKETKPLPPGKIVQTDEFSVEFESKTKDGNRI